MEGGGTSRTVNVPTIGVIIEGEDVIVELWSVSLIGKVWHLERAVRWKRWGR